MHVDARYNLNNYVFTNALVTSSFLLLVVMPLLLVAMSLLLV